MRVLTIDIGNTAVKGSVFENGILIESIPVSYTHLTLPTIGG